MRWFALGLVACTPASHPAPPAPPAPIVAHAELVIRFAARGATIKQLASGDTLACSPHGACICLTELQCKGECITLAKNLAVFEQALNGDNDGRSVSCEIADTGRLCDASYFRFEGDIYRWEDRFFDAGGHLIGQRNATDYPEYCDGQANIRFMGAAPDCSAPARDVKRICSDAANRERPPLGNPLADLLGSVAE